MKTAILICLLALCTIQVHSKGTDTFQVYFGLKEAELNQQAQASLDKIIKTKIIAGEDIMLMGYADYRGTSGYNDTISLQRALNVQDYLVAHGVEKQRISTCTGKGKIERPGMTGKNGNAKDRKVLVIVNYPKTPIEMKDVEVNKTFTLKNISFSAGNSALLPSSLPELENLYRFMVQNSTVTIQIEGHICCYTKGADDDLSFLSHERAQAVYKYLTDKGIAPERMKFVGMGFKHPLVYPEYTDEDRQKNRRVEIRILSK